MKRILSFISFLMLSSFCTLSFLPIMFKLLWWKREKDSWGGYLHRHSPSNDQLYNLFSEDTAPISYIVFAFAIVGLFAFILHFIRKKSAILNLLTFSPIVSCILLAITTYLRVKRYTVDDELERELYSYGEYTLGWGLYISFAILIIVSIFSFLVVLDKGGDTIIKYVNEKHESADLSRSSIMDELTAYKDLFDKGVITKDEFEAKKKQLLGL